MKVELGDLAEILMKLSTDVDDTARARAMESDDKVRSHAINVHEHTVLTTVSTYLRGLADIVATLP